MGKRLWFPIVIAIMVIGGGAVLIHKEGQVFDQKFLGLNDRTIGSRVQINTTINEKSFFERKVTVEVMLKQTPIVKWTGDVHIGWGVKMDLFETPDSALSQHLKAFGVNSFEGKVNVKAPPVGGRVHFQWAVEPLVIHKDGYVCHVGPSAINIETNKKGVNYKYEARNIQCDLPVNEEQLKLAYVDLNVDTITSYGALKSAASDLKLGAMSLTQHNDKKLSWRSMRISKTLERAKNSQMNLPVNDVHVDWMMDHPVIDKIGSTGKFSGDIYFEDMPPQAIYLTNWWGLTPEQIHKSVYRSLQRAHTAILVMNISVEKGLSRSFVNGQIRFNGRVPELGEFNYSITPKSWVGLGVIQKFLTEQVQAGHMFLKDGIYSGSFPFSDVVELYDTAHAKQLRAYEQEHLSKLREAEKHELSHGAASGSHTGHDSKKGKH